MNITDNTHPSFKAILTERNANAGPCGGRLFFAGDKNEALKKSRKASAAHLKERLPISITSGKIAAYVAAAAVVAGGIHLLTRKKTRTRANRLAR